MEKEFIPYELAVKLKELGFKLSKDAVFGFYCEEEYFIHDTLLERVVLSKNKFGHIDKIISAPLFQQVFEWFRINRLNLSVVGFQNDYGYNYEIYSIEHKECSEYIDSFKTYEEARLDCLEKLIEIIEENV